MEGFRFDLSDATFDFCSLFSVFTHMYEADIRLYLAEIKRLLRVGGVAGGDVFLLNDQRVEWLSTRTTGLTMHHVLNAHTRYHNANDKLHAIAFDRDWVRQTIEGFGFEILQTTAGHWAGDASPTYQDQVVVRKRGA